MILAMRLPPAHTYRFLASIGLLASLLSCGARREHSMPKKEAPVTREAKAVTLPSFDRFAVVTDVAVSGIGEMSGCSAGSSGMTEEEFRRLIVSAVPVQRADPMLEGWSFAYAYSGAFSTREGRFRFTLYAGELGRLDTPRNEYGYFRYRR